MERSESAGDGAAAAYFDVVDAMGRADFDGRRLELQILDTILFRGGRPVSWLFTTTEGVRGAGVCSLSLSLSLSRVGVPRERARRAERAEEQSLESVFKLDQGTPQKPAKNRHIT